MAANQPVIYECTVEPQWLDYNHQLNVAYYARVFDDAGEEFVKVFGMGLAYTERTQNSWMVVEAHITYQTGAQLGDRLRVESRVLDFTPKLAHLYQEMYRDQTLLTTQEQLMLHVSLETRRSAPFAPEVLAQLAALHAQHQILPRPATVGRSINIHPRRS
jgi:acyl-CoA thioester hydrolase